MVFMRKNKTFNPCKKKQVLSFILTILYLSSSPLFAQITINTSNSNTQLVNNVLLGGGVTATNVTWKGVLGGAGVSNKFQIAQFSNAGSTLASMGFLNGVVLTSGNVNDIPNSSTCATMGSGGYYSTTTGEYRTDADAVILGGSGSDDKNTAVLEFDFIPTSDSIQFRYCFASQEYPGFNCTQYNDVFGFLLSGPGIAGGQGFSNNAVNLALLPGSTNTYVTINNVNDGTSAGTLCTLSPAQRQANFKGTIPGIAFCGFTKVFVARAKVTPCQTYHIKMVIADVTDGALDSGVFIEGGSFKSNGVSASVSSLNNNNVPSIDTILVEGCNKGVVTFHLNDPATAATTINYSISGNSTNGIDYNSLNGSVVIPAGQDSVQLIINPIADGANEGDEVITLTFNNGIACNSVNKVVSFIIKDGGLLTLNSTTTSPSCGSSNGSIQLTVLGGTPPYQYSINGGSNFQSSNSFSSLPANTYFILVKDASSCAQASDTITLNTSTPVNSPTVSNDTICQGDPPVNFQAIGTGTLNWYTSLIGGTAVTTTPSQSSDTVGTYTYYVSQTISGCESPRIPVAVMVNPTLKPVVLLTGTTSNSATFSWTNVSGASSYNISCFINSTSVLDTIILNTLYTATGLSNGDSVSIIVTPIGNSSICYVSDTAYTVIENSTCGSCSTPSCPVANVPTFEDRSYLACNSSINLAGPLSYTQYHLVTADAGGMIGLAQSVQSIGTVTRSAYILPVGNCSATPILPSENWVHSDVIGSGFNPEWYGLTPGAQYVLVIDFVIPAGVTLEYTCADYYGIPLYCGTPGITSPSTTFNCTDTLVDLTAFEPVLANGFSVPSVTLEIFDVNATGNNISLGIMEGATVAGTIPVSFASNQYYSADLYWWDPTDPFGISVTDPTGNSDYFYRVIEYGTGKVLAWGHITFTAAGNVIKSNLCSTNGTVTWLVDGFPYGAGISDGINHGSGEAILNPSLLSLGNHTITYSWNNGLTGSNACSGTADLNIIVTGSVSQPSIGGNNLVCTNDSNVNYAVQFNNGSTYSWTVPSGVTIVSGQGTNSINVNWGSTSGQIYCVESNNCGSSPQDTFIVNVQTIVPLSPIVGTLSVCPFTSNLNYTVNNPNPGSTFSWTINGGTIVSGDGTSSVVVDWGNIGNATLIVIENTVCGPQGPDTLTCIISNPPVSPLITFPNDTICSFTSNQTYSVINNPTSNYLWTVPVGATIISGQGTNAITVNWGDQSSSGSVTVTEVSVCGNGALAQQPIEVLPSPANPIINGPDSVCPGQTSVQYSVSSTYGSAYNWSVNNGTIVSGNNTNSIMVNWSSNNNGSVTISQNNLCGTTIPNTLNIIIENINVGLPSITQICPGEFSALSVSGTASSFIWTPSATLNNSSVSNPIASPLLTTTYTAISNDNCLISDTVTVIVKPLPDPEFITLNDQNELYSNIQLVNLTNPYTSIAWQIRDSLILDVLNPSFTSYDTGWVKVTQYAELNGCKDTLTREIYIKDIKTVYIPNAFTPDDDFKNEKFRIVVNGYQKIDVYIYNRWGSLVKEWHNLNDGWDGKYNNTDAPVDVYAYKVLLYESMDSPAKKEITGTVNLIR
jgi:gliding motility-associated-like protein